jgi:aminoglycoside phosphotransferase (APT) family kinase protein
VSVSQAAVDVARLHAWMREHAPQCEVRDTTVIEVARIGGGYSNLTFAVTLRDGAATRRLVLRRPPVGVTADRGAHDMRREYRVLRSVHGTSVPVPEPMALCDDAAVLGGEFFLMAHVPGVAVRTVGDAPVLTDPAVMRRFSEATIDALADLHALPVTPMPIFDAARVDGYGARQVENWRARGGRARPADVPDADAAMVFTWLRESLPAAMAPALLHNDWKFDNLLVSADDPSVIHGVLDWEMATVGDPRFDLATALGYWVQASDPPALQALALGVTNLPGCLTRREVVQRYAARRGISIAQPEYWYAFGLAKVAVIVVQLYARFVAGASRDARFAGLGGVAALLMQTAHRAIVERTVESV